MSSHVDLSDIGYFNLAEEWERCQREYNGDIEAYAASIRAGLESVDWGAPVDEDSDWTQAEQLDEAEDLIVRELTAYRDCLN